MKLNCPSLGHGFDPHRPYQTSQNKRHLRSRVSNSPLFITQSKTRREVCSPQGGPNGPKTENPFPHSLEQKEAPDWEGFDTRHEATARALELASPGALFTIEEFFSTCPLYGPKAASAD